MKTYGTISRTGGNWIIQCDAYCMIRLKRIFERVRKDFGKVIIKDTEETCRELVWFMQRFPLVASAPDRMALEARLPCVDAGLLVQTSRRRLDLVRAGAWFSLDRRYRYRLWRMWGFGPCACFILLNPSTADADVNDPTVERCERRARRWGYGGLEILNAFAYRSTDPGALVTIADPVGEHNYTVIWHVANESALVVVGWGSNAARPHLAHHVVNLEQNVLHGIPLYSLGVNAGGHPRHPLYVPFAVTPIPYGHATAWSMPKQLDTPSTAVQRDR